MGRALKYLPFLFNVTMSLWAMDALLRTIDLPQPLDDQAQREQAVSIIASFALFAGIWVLAAYGLRMLVRRYDNPSDDTDAFT